jgi:PAS domain S-box-containing protein
MRQQPITWMTCPESLVRYVIRTCESVILDDASKPNLFSADEYLRDRQSRSILCLPLVKQGGLTGILLLENALTSHAFTPARIAVLEQLAAQAAISLENTRLYSDLREREAKIRRLVDANIIGVLTIDLDGQILEANDVFLTMVGYDREDLAAGRVRWTNAPEEWRDGDPRRVETVKTTGTLQAFEKEYFRKDGSRVPALVGVARIEETRNQAVAFVIDLTKRKQAESEARESERRYREVQMQLAHASRVATMGQLTASIAHEVNQPIAATLMNAGTAVRFLARQPPNLEQAREAINHIISDGNRIADIVSRIRNFSKNAPAQNTELEINEAILEIMTLARAAVSDHGVLVKMQLSDGLPHIPGDRIQLQQVILNLVMNAVEAISEVTEGSRELLISTSEAESGSVLVAVSDSGPGLPQANLDRLFEAFYTTKASGLGMGLSICRSIVEAHGGRLWATPNEPHGADAADRGKGG